MRTSKPRQRAVQPQPKPRVTLSAKRQGDPLVESPRRVAVGSFASNARPVAVLSQRITPWTVVAMTAMASPSRLWQLSPLSPRSPTRKFGGDKNMAFMQSMFKAYVKSQSLRNVRNMTMTPGTVLTVNKKLGMATRS